LRLPEGEHLPHQFLKEAKTLARLRLPGVVQIFDAIRWNGTVYSIMEYLANARDLDEVLQAERVMEPSRVRAMLLTLCEVLEQVHKQGFLHRDIKPSNILLLPDDRPVLIDFGSAREWHADKTVQHTVMFTPGYAPIEQLGTIGRRGPESDLYSLAATAYEALTGNRPASAADRVGGLELVPIRRLRPDVPEGFAHAIEHALAIESHRRPGTAAEWARELDSGDESDLAPGSDTIDAYDAKLVALQRLKFGKKECPSCQGVLDTPTPLKPNVCPVCRRGRLVNRDIDERRCPVCRSGFLKELKNSNPIKLCPLCKSGRLRKRGILGKTLSCQTCSALFARSGNELTLEDGGSSRSDLAEVGSTGDSDAYWLPLSGRSGRVVRCEGCASEWDELANGDLRLFSWRDDPFGVARRYKCLSRGEWARVALRLSPDAGNVVCSGCSADYFAESGTLTLLDADHDAFGFAAAYQARRLETEAVRFIGVDKASGKAGPVCGDCRTEFDVEGDYLRLRATGNRALRSHIGEARPLEDWHRLARGLPAIDEEDAWMSAFEALLQRSMLGGGIQWANKKRPEILWQSQSERLGTRGTLILTATGIDFQAKRNGWKAPLDVVRSVEVEGDVVTLRVVGEAEPLAFRIMPETVAVDLASGRREVELDAECFAEALRSAQLIS
ncbi:MAG: protein kinase, partial [Armatimonadota bacterium]|nr:protein kinase [Armatimonadota bacterium]